MLELKGISKTFNPGSLFEKKALVNINLSVEEGEFISIIGANGAGKSTLFNAISGSFLTDEGSIVLDGEDITFLPDHKRAKTIGRLFQDPLRGTAPAMSIEENLALASGRGGWLSSISKKDKEDFRERLSALSMGLEDRMKQPVGLLSGGQRQALTLLMATLRKPKLLLLDEHTAALDPKTAKKVLDLTEHFIKKDNLTAFMITHNMKDAIKYGNRLIMMMDGKIVYDVSGEEKQKLEVSDLLKKFQSASGDWESSVSDKMLLI